MDRIADQRITRVHAEIQTIDYARRLEADPLIGSRKFAGDLYIQADGPRHAEQGQIVLEIKRMPGKFVTLRKASLRK